MALATPKQINLIITLMGRGRMFRSAADIPEARARAAKLTVSEASDCIKKLNEYLGFSQSFSRATDKQRSFIRDLERKVHGKPQTTPSDLLTYEQADTRIKYLKQALEHQTATADTAVNVIDFFTKVAV